MQTDKRWAKIWIETLLNVYRDEKQAYKKMFNFNIISH